MLNKAHVVEITKARQEIPWLFDVERRKKNRRWRKCIF